MGDGLAVLGVLGQALYRLQGIAERLHTDGPLLSIFFETTHDDLLQGCWNGVG